MTMPRHVQAKLIGEGVINERRLTEYAQRWRCPLGCGAELLASQDMGLERWADPVPLTPLGELQAILAGRATYWHVMGYLEPRRERDIEGMSAADTDVLAEHRCHAPPVQVDETRIRKYTPVDTSGPPPF
jgi:hypothetical protein